MIYWWNRFWNGQHCLAVPINLPAGLSSLTPAALGATRESTAPTLGLWTRLIHVERATFQAGAIQRRYCPFRLGRIRHLDESETARTAGVSVRNQVDTFHFSVRLKKRSHRRLGCGKVQISYEDVFHVLAPSIFQLCRQDEADRNSQALAGL
jgi:hypothetical protein